MIVCKLLKKYSVTKHNTKHKMGFSLYLDVVVTCPLLNYLKHCKNLLLKNEDMDEYYEINNAKFENWVKEHASFDPWIFFDSIEIERREENSTIGVRDWEYDIFDDQDKDADETGFHITNYLDHLLFNVIIKALEDKNDDVITKFCALFDDIEELSISKAKQTIKFTIFYGSSYKGRESIDINFTDIGAEISSLKNVFGDIKVKTYIGYN
jgi:hypothetical protein